MRTCRTSIATTRCRRDGRSRSASRPDLVRPHGRRPRGPVPFEARAGVGRLRRGGDRCGRRHRRTLGRAPRMVPATDRLVRRTGVARCRSDLDVRPTTPARRRSSHRRDDEVMTTTPAVTPDVAAAPLTDAEARARAAAGRANTVVDRTSRPISVIVRANVLTRFNALLGSLLVVILIVGPVQDALFGIILVGNTLVGIVQEVRAKRTLDRLVVVGGATATVMRAEGRREVPSRDVVEGDIVEVGRGESIVVEGVVLMSDDLEVDESLLTGESEPMAKPQGSTLLSGSWVVAGNGRHLAEVVGEASYGRRLAAEG